jgi:hypothetical protein
MLHTFIVTVTTNIDGTTLFGPPDPSPLAADETGLISFTVANAGILNPASILRFVGPGGWLLAGVSLQSAAGGRVGIIQPQTFTTQQDIIVASAAPSPPYAYRPTYVPAGWRVRFNAQTVAGGTLRIDLCPLRDFKTAVRGIASTRLRELVPNLA